MTDDRRRSTMHRENERNERARKSGNVTRLNVGVERAHVPEAVRHDHRTNHPEYPLERLCVHLYEPFQLTFARHAEQLFQQRDDVELIASHQGLTIRGETEESIEAAVRVLRDFYGPQIRIDPPTIRYHNGATLEQPWMGLRVRCPADRVEAVKTDLIVRDATIVTSAIHANAGEIQACGPLAYLIGYRSAFEKLTSGSGWCVMWLSHYAPVDHPPGGDAA
jgi:Elongation factor G C-terminus